MDDKQIKYLYDSFMDKTKQSMTFEEFSDHIKAYEKKYGEEKNERKKNTQSQCAD